MRGAGRGTRHDRMARGGASAMTGTIQSPTRNRAHAACDRLSRCSVCDVVELRSRQTCVPGRLPPRTEPSPSSRAVASPRPGDCGVARGGPCGGWRRALHDAKPVAPRGVSPHARLPDRPGDDPQVKRRKFIAVLTVSAAWPFAAHAQLAKQPTIGFLGPLSPAAQSKWTAAFVRRLREHGWIEGRTVAIEYRWAE